MDLQYGDSREPFAAAKFSICVVDSGYDPGADPTQVRHQTQRGIGGPPIGTNGADLCQKPLSRAFEQDASLIKRWMEREFPKLQRRWRRRSVPSYFPATRAAYGLRFHAATWGIRGKTQLLPVPANGFHLNMLSAISAKGELRFMTSRKAHFGGAVHRFLRRRSRIIRERYFVVIGWLAGAQSQVGAAVFVGVKTASDYSCRHIRLRSIRTSWSGMTSRTTVLDAP